MGSNIQTEIFHTLHNTNSNCNREWPFNTGGEAFSELNINIFDHFPRGPVAWPSCLPEFIGRLPDL